MFATLFAMSWVGICFILIALYLVFLVLRGLVDFVRYLVEDLRDDVKIRDPKPRRARSKPQKENEP